MATTTEKPVVLSGMRPTGLLHLGHLEGALRNWVRLQDQYKCFYFVADWHALTTGYEHTENIVNDRLEMVIDWLAAGIDPEKSTLFVQSWLPEHAVLHLLLSMIVPIPWLERNPSYKDMVQELNLGESAGYGLLGYPVLQAADILIYHASYVPVGKDQLPHLELTREIARRFNYLYGDTLREPEALLTEFPMIPGIDGRKMSKSYGNDVRIADDDDTLRRKIMQMFTDPRKIRKGDPGHPDECPVCYLQQVYGSPNLEEIRRTCADGTRGCVECKAELAEQILRALTEVRARRREYAAQRDRVERILRDGTEKARAVAGATLETVIQAMRL
jgi:tryptophanyl-tRNA synthetase